MIFSANAKNGHKFERSQARKFPLDFIVAYKSAHFLVAKNSDTQQLVQRFSQAGEKEILTKKTVPPPIRFGRELLINFFFTINRPTT